MALSVSSRMRWRRSVAKMNFRVGTRAAGSRRAVGSRPTAGACRIGVVAALSPPLAACSPATLAEADRSSLTVEAAAELAGRYGAAPVDSLAVGAIAELWVDYTLLATRLSEDATLASLDVRAVAEPLLDGLMLERLWEADISVDTSVGDAELAERFAAETPGARATASQILLLFGQDATRRERDSVRAVAEGLRAELAGGADFGTLARRHSDDPGSGRRGGSLGDFERGDMLPAVDSAVFALAPGQISHPVESAIGYHVLRLEGLGMPAISEVADRLRLRIRAERIAEAEAAYIAELGAARGFALAENAVMVARALAAAPGQRLSRRAAERSLATWDGGAYRVGALLAALGNASEELAATRAEASDEEWKEALGRQAETAMLVDEARARGFVPTAAESDSIETAARAAIRDFGLAIGLMEGVGADSAGGESADADAGGDALAEPGAAGRSVEGAVADALAAIVSGRRRIVPLGQIAELLRSQGAWRIHEKRIGATVSRGREIMQGR